ncbi:MAG: dodecin family protein [Acidimicrobiia bacterium]|nr:dodecin family protein [Acidimicrobiia bacterium]MBT8248758.1 dodecin family protein [Acidimicrobiia bacterium]NNC43380.1 dodecin domain-containing protein [Acidimicrobiia bacterium]NND14206.1 dodecin domain-containing protein [Acidimicrobiia bacterium]NNL26932.1 dodecin domain-containing protein [Acidimicrobiia bacterium]
MTVAKVIEISSRSDVSFDDAIESGIEKASDSLNNMEAAWVQDQQVLIKDGKITGYQVSLRITFIVG